MQASYQVWVDYRTVSLSKIHANKPGMGYVYLHWSRSCMQEQGSERTSNLTGMVIAYNQSIGTTYAYRHTLAYIVHTLIGITCACNWSANGQRNPTLHRPIYVIHNITHFQSTTCNQSMGNHTLLYCNHTWQSVCVIDHSPQFSLGHSIASIFCVRRSRAANMPALRAQQNLL